MLNWLKTAGKWGGIFLMSVLVFLTVALVINPDLGSGLHLQSEGGWGIIFSILALVITLLKQIIAFIGFLTTAIKILIVLVFAAVFLFIGMLVLRTLSSARRRKEEQ